MSPLLDLAFCAAKAVATVFLTAFAGVLLLRFKCLKEESLKTLNLCVFTTFLPCLLFTKVAERIDLPTLKLYWSVPVFCVAFVFSGLLFGYLLAKALRHPPHFFKAGIAASAFGNISFIPIPLVAAMALVFPAFAARPGAAALGVSYISLYLMVYSPLLWSVGFRLLSAEKSRKSENNLSLLEILNPPLLGMGLGILVGTMPPLKGLLVGPDALLSPLFHAAELVGGAAIPCALISLGGRLSDGPTNCALPLRTILGISFAKLLLLPSFALLCVWLAMRTGFLPRDPLLGAALVIEAAVPQATNLQIMCSLRNPAIEKDMSCLLFWNYLAAVPLLALFMVLTLLLLG